MKKKHSKGKDGEVEYGEHKGPFHGSPMESHTSGHGGHLGGYKTRPITIGMHPGRAAIKVKPHLEGGSFEGGKESSKSKIRMAPRGQEEDQ